MSRPYGAYVPVRFSLWLCIVGRQDFGVFFMSYRYETFKNNAARTYRINSVPGENAAGTESTSLPLRLQYVSAMAFTLVVHKSYSPWCPESIALEVGEDALLVISIPDSGHWQAS
jgi:hypothetical protein